MYIRIYIYIYIYIYRERERERDHMIATCFATLRDYFICGNWFGRHGKVTLTIYWLYIILISDFKHIVNISYS